MKKIVMFFLFTLLNLFTITTFAGVLPITMNNWSYGEPISHNLSYFVTNITKDSEIRGSTSGTLVPMQYSDVDILRYDNNDITAHLKVVDPESGNRIVWEGDLNYDGKSNTINMIVNNQDKEHYLIHATINQGYPDFRLWVALTKI